MMRSQIICSFTTDEVTQILEALAIQYKVFENLLDKANRRDDAYLILKRSCELLKIAEIQDYLESKVAKEVFDED